MNRKGKLSVILLLCVYLTICKSQTIIKNYQPYLGVDIDSIFVHFEAPKIPTIVYNDNMTKHIILSIRILCAAKIDTSGYCKALRIYPLYEDGNDLNETDSIWVSIRESVIKSSRKWIFKPVYRDIYVSIKNDTAFDKSNIKNNKSILNKYNGCLDYYFILNFNILEDMNTPQFLFWLNCEPKYEKDKGQ